MSESSNCPQCGTANTPGANFCLKCGSVLPRTAPPSASASPGTPPSGWPPASYAYASAFSAQKRITEINRTSMGLLFLLIGLVLGPIPFVGIIGLILDIIGAILVILGRGVFGPNHSRNVILAVVIFVIGLCVIAGSILSLFLTIFSATYTASSGGTVDPTALSQAISSSFQTFIIGTAVGGAIDGVAIVLFTYAIQNQNGKMLLWAGYAISIAVSIITILVVGPLISEAVTQAFAGSTFNPAPVSDLQAQAQLWGLLGLIPSILYAGAFYLVRSRIDKGQVLKPRNILRS